VRPAPEDLAIEHVTVRFGGMTAVSDLSLIAPAGKITGLIGPNGAGKTTTFNACSGFVHVAHGAIRLGGTALDPLGAAARAKRGLGRTFQRMELWGSFPVRENIVLGVECAFAAHRPWGQLIGSRQQRKQAAERAADAIDRCGLENVASRPAGALSTGQRRLVELARAMASPFCFLMLDEPSSGLDGSETEHFGRVLTDFVKDTGVGVLLVEHDMALVGSICSYLYVLDFGCLIFDAPTEQVMRSEVVRAAYLGTQAASESPLDAEVGLDV
jgi:ABC-type branched-subunit amino acid transport system ATPase component